MTVTVYAVPEPIAESMSMLNGLATLFFSFAALVASIPIGIAINYVFTENMNAMQQKAISLAFICGVLISGVLLVLAVVCTCKRKSTWDKVKLASQAR